MQNRIQYLKQTSYHNVTSNNASSGLKENVILAKHLVPKYGWKIDANMELGEGTPGRTILTNQMCVYPPMRGPNGTGKEDMEGGISVDRELVCLVVPHSKCVTAYLPRILFRGGSLTLINMAFFMVLVTPWNFLSTMKKLYSLME